MVDGDILLSLSEDNLTNDLEMANGITRKRSETVFFINFRCK